MDNVQYNNSQLTNDQDLRTTREISIPNDVGTAELSVVDQDHILMLEHAARNLSKKSPQNTFTNFSFDQRQGDITAVENQAFGGHTQSAFQQSRFVDAKASFPGISASLGTEIGAGQIDSSAANDYSKQLENSLRATDQNNMLAKNTQAIFTDDDMFSHLGLARNSDDQTQSQFRDRSVSRTKKSKTTLQVLKPKVTNIGMGNDDDQQLRDDHQSQRNLSCLSNKIIQQANIRQKPQNLRNNKLRTTHESLQRHTVSDLKFILDTTINSSSHVNRVNFAVARNQQNTTQQFNSRFANQFVANDIFSNENQRFSDFGIMPKINSSNQQNMSKTQLLGQKMRAQNATKRMPVAQTFNLKQKLNKFQNRVSFENYSQLVANNDNWSPIKKNDIVLAMERAGNREMNQTKARGISHSQIGQQGLVKNRPYQTQREGFFVAHQYQYQKMMQEQQNRVGNAPMPNEEQSFEQVEPQQHMRSSQRGFMFQGSDSQTKNFVGLQGMPLGTSADLTALSYSQNLGFTASINGDQEYTSETGGETVYHHAQNSQNSANDLNLQSGAKQSIKEIKKKNNTPAAEKIKALKTSINSDLRQVSGMNGGRSPVYNKAKKNISGIMDRNHTGSFDLAEDQDNDLVNVGETQRSDQYKLPAIQPKIQIINQLNVETEFTEEANQSRYKSPHETHHHEMIPSTQQISQERIENEVLPSTCNPNSPQSQVNQEMIAECFNHQSFVQLSRDNNQKPNSNILQSIGSVQQHEFQVAKDGPKLVTQILKGASVQSQVKNFGHISNNNRITSNKVSAQGFGLQQSVDSSTTAGIGGKMSRPLINGTYSAAFALNESIKELVIPKSIASLNIDRRDQSPKVIFPTNRVLQQSALLLPVNYKAQQALQSGQTSYNDISGFQSSIRDDKLYSGQGKVLLTQGDEYQLERKFPGGIKSYIPKSISPLKTQPEIDQLKQDKNDPLPSHLKGIKSKSKRKENIIQSRSQVKSYSSLMKKGHDDNDHAKKVGNLGYIQMGGLIPGFGNPFDPNIKQKSATSKILERALGNHEDLFEQATVTPASRQSAIITRIKEIPELNEPEPNTSTFESVTKKEVAQERPLKIIQIDSETKNNVLRSHDSDPKIQTSNNLSNISSSLSKPNNMKLGRNAEFQRFNNKKNNYQITSKIALSKTELANGRDKFVSNQKQLEVHQMTYDAKKDYIQEQVLKNSTEWEHLQQFASNKIQMDTKAHASRIDSQRKRDDARDLSIAKKDPLYDYYQSLKVQQQNQEASPDKGKKKERKIPGVSTDPFILPQVAQKNEEPDDRNKATENITKFLKNFKCKQSHPMMLLNRIPDGISNLVRKSMICKTCTIKIRNGDEYIHCGKCSDYYCHQHLIIRKVNDLDDLRERLGFVNKKLQLQNKIAAMIIIIQEEKEKKQLQLLSSDCETSEQLDQRDDRRNSNFKETLNLPKNPFDAKKMSIKSDDVTRKDINPLDQFSFELTKLQQKMDQDIKLVGGDDETIDIMQEILVKSGNKKGDTSMEVSDVSDIGSSQDLSSIKEEGTVDENPSPMGMKMGENPYPNHSNRKTVQIDMNSKLYMQRDSTMLSNQLKKQRTVFTSVSPVKELTEYEQRRIDFAQKLQVSKKKQLILKDRKVQAALKRSPIQREHHQFLSNLNEKIDQIDLSGALQAYQNRKNAGKKQFISSKKETGQSTLQSSKGFEKTGSQFGKIKNSGLQSVKSNSNQKKKETNSSHNHKDNVSTHNEDLPFNLLKSINESAPNISIDNMSSMNSVSERQQEHSDWIHLDLLRGADPTQNDQTGTIAEQCALIRKEIDQKYDLFYDLQKSDTYIKAQKSKQDAKKDITSYLTPAEKKILAGEDTPQEKKQELIAKAEDTRTKEIQTNKRLAEEKKLAKIEQSGGGMSANDIMNLMGDDMLVERYSKHLNKILFKFCDPFVRKKYDDYLELTEPSQQKDFFSRMKMDKQARDDREKQLKLQEELAQLDSAMGGATSVNNSQARV